jgi:hypothetical protein
MPDRETEQQILAYVKAMTDPTDEERRQRSLFPEQEASQLSNEQIIAGLWRAANAPLTEKELAIKERAAALSETKTPDPTLDAERQQRRSQQRL